MLVIQYFLLILSGLSAGFITAAAFVTFISLIGVFSKMAAKTNTGQNCMLYENLLTFGILLSTFFQFFTSFHSAGISEIGLPPPLLGVCFLLFIGFFGGIYIGFLIAGLSEVLNVIPIYATKTHITKNLRWIIFFLALGKGVFTILQFLILKV